MRKKKLIFIFVAAIVVFVSGEIFARFKLGLGDPPVSIVDSDIDYLFAPNQRCMRFGNEVCYNNLSMRTRENVVDETRRRVFLCGDSVVNGGVLTDQSELATELLQEARKEYQVCNVSAGSWGPGNLVAYFRKFPVVRTNDVLFIEVNSHDLWEDDPKQSAGRNVGKDISLPDHKPWCALWDGFDRYFVPYVRRKLHLATINNKVDVAHWGSDSETDAQQWNLRQMELLYALPCAQKYLVVHRSHAESEKNVESPGEKGFVEHAKAHGIPAIYLQLTSFDYRDTIHLNSNGQRKLFELLNGHIK